MSAPKASIRAVVDRLLQHYFDQLFDRLANEVRQSRAELEGGLAGVRAGTHAEAWASAQDTREAIQESVQEAAQDVYARLLRELHEAKGALQRDLTVTQLKSDQRHREALSEVGETRGALQRDLASARGALQADLISARDEVRGALQADLISARDEVRGTVELFRHAFDDFRAQVEPRVYSLEKRMDALELRMLTYQSLQKDFAQMRSRDMAAVRSEAAALREDVRKDMADLSRILMMQGDAADQVAEALGRTLARLSGDLEALAQAVDGAGSLREATPQPA